MEPAIVVTLSRQARQNNENENEHRTLNKSGKICQNCAKNMTFQTILCLPIVWPLGLVILYFSRELVPVVSWYSMVFYLICHSQN